MQDRGNGFNSSRVNLLHKCEVRAFVVLNQVLLHERKCNAEPYICFGMLSMQRRNIRINRVKKYEKRPVNVPNIVEDIG